MGHAYECDKARRIDLRWYKKNLKTKRNGHKQIITYIQIEAVKCVLQKKSDYFFYPIL